MQNLKETPRYSRYPQFLKQFPPGGTIKCFTEVKNENTILCTTFFSETTLFRSNNALSIRVGQHFLQCWIPLKMESPIMSMGQFCALGCFLVSFRASWL